jgi:GT2 family glycosyltransferase
VTATSPDARAREALPDLAISIGTLGRVEMLERCLATVYEEDDPDLRFEVWVVYNGSEDPAIVRRIRDELPRVRLIVRRGPLGYCGTHNLVLNEAPARYVLVLDDDTLVPKGLLPAMVRFMDENPRVGLAGCKTLNVDGSHQPSFGLVPTLRSELTNAFRPDSFWHPELYRDPDAVKDVEWLNGSFMLVRREALLAVGGLDEHYYTYVCEADWAERFRRAGWRVTYVGTVAIVHEGGEHSINNKLTVTNAANVVRYHANRFYFFRKHHGAAAVWVLRPLMAIGSALRLAFYLPWLRGDAERRAVGRAKIRAFWRVIRLSLGPRPWEMPDDLRPGAVSKAL